MKLKVWMIVIAIASLSTGCSSDDGQLSLPSTNGFAFSNIEIADIEGTWQATEVRFTSIDDQPVKEVELVAAGGSGALIVNFDGRFTLIIKESDGGGGVLTGGFSIDNGVFTVVFDDKPNNIVAWVAQSSGNTLLLQGPGNYDFEGDGNLEKVTVVLDLIRD